MFDVTLLTVCYVHDTIKCKSVQWACADETTSLTAGQEQLLKLTMQWRHSHPDRTSNLPPHHDKEQTSPLASFGLPFYYLWAINFREYGIPVRGPFSKQYFRENTDESG